MNFNKIALATGLAASGVGLCGFFEYANAAVFNVNSTNYNIVTVAGTANAYTAETQIISSQRNYPFILFISECSVLEANTTGCDDSRENNQYPSGSGNNQYPSGSGGNNPTGSSGNDDLSNQGNNSNNNEDSEKSTPDCNYSYSDDSNPIEASACRRNNPGY
jgi:hypothetical protein